MLYTQLYFRAEREKLIMQDIEEETLKEIECRLNWDVENVERRTKEVEDCIVSSNLNFFDEYKHFFEFSVFLPFYLP